MSELLPRIKELAALAKSYDIGFNIDAEEADRLDLSLDLLEALCLDPDLKGWNGLGFVIQAYGKRCSSVIDWLVDLARRSDRRLMVRLVKGAYWDSEIKRAQVDGLDGFPVFTRKVHTDVCYLACGAQAARRAGRGLSRNSPPTTRRRWPPCSSIAGPSFYRGQYEFQCLHGMGEPLYEEVVGRDKLDRPCRVYAPVGSHRDAARLSGAPPARERRQHFVRQPHRRRERARGRPRRRSGGGRARHPADRRAARKDRRCRATFMRRIA